MPKKITFLVTGGAGFLGQSLCTYLVKKGHRVRSLDVLTHDDKVLQTKVKHFLGDVRNPQLLQQAMKNVDMVVHAAAALPLWKRQKIFSINVKGTRMVLEAAVREKVKRVIFISSTAVYGIPKRHPLHETDPLRGVGPYGESKILAERTCEQYRSTLCIPILRPKTFVGKGRLGVFQILFEWIREGRNIPIVGRGKNRYQLLDVEDLNDAIYLAATKPEKKCNQTFNVGAEEFTTMKEDFGALVKAGGHGKKIIATPAKPVIAVLRAMEFFKLSPLYQWIYETADKDSFVSVDKIKKELGWKATKSNKQMLIETYQWYCENYTQYKGKAGITHRVPWKQGILSLVGKFF